MRTALSRILLVGFLGLAIVAVVVGTSGGGNGDLSFGSLDPDDLEYRAFVLEDAGRFAIEAAGSFEEAGTPSSDTTMAAYGWIVRRETGDVVWQMRPRRPERGTLAAVADTFDLEAGTYDAYFTSLGDPLVRDPGPRDGSLGERIRAALSRGGRSWVGDAGRWKMNLFALDAGSRIRTSGFERDPSRAEINPSPLLVWDARGVEDRERREAVLHVLETSTIDLEVVTEITAGVVADVPSVVRLGSQDTVWTATGDGTWVGGSLKNRRVEDSVTLEPGLYRVAFEADRSHAYNDWTANPPLVPSSWGIRVERASPDAAVQLLDPADLDLPQVITFECVGPDSERRATFTLPTSTDVLLVAVGEVVSGSEYDFATLERFGSDHWDDVWEMDDDNTTHAGGADKNRRATVALSLEPGRYRLTYETDGSHDCESGYNEGAPDGDLWGVMLYAIDPTLDVSTLNVSVEPQPIVGGSEPVEVGLLDPKRLLARIDSVGDDQDRRARFTLTEPTRLEIRAAGELSDSNPYDWAAIYKDDGALVWQMTWENTAPGESASSYHRIFQGPLDLEPGSYTVRYRTDGSRSFADFGDSSRILWGVHVYGPADVLESEPQSVDPDDPPPPMTPAPPPAPTNSV